MAELADADAVRPNGRRCRTDHPLRRRSPMKTTFDRILAANISAHTTSSRPLAGTAPGLIVYASSNHAIGFYTRDDRLDANVRQRPDSLYGVSKAFGEDLASMYADKYGVESACLRIGTARPDPVDPRHLSTWQSYEDLLRHDQACFAAPKLGCTILYGVSDNDRGWWSNDAPRTSTIARRTMPSGLPQLSFPMATSAIRKPLK